MRLDQALVAQNFYPTRAKAVSAIDAGLVLVNGAPAKKPSQPIFDGDKITAEPLPYTTGRGSLKLAHALEHFGINPSGMACLDIGASTGGFTEVLLKNGAGRVYAVDVGTDQLIPELRTHPRVVSLEQTDIRDLAVQSMVDLIVIDVSFISLTNIVSVLPPWGAKDIIALIKPQFEVPRETSAKFNGVIKSPELHTQSIDNVTNAFAKSGFRLCGITQSPILGGSGNTEFLAHFTKNN